MNALYESYVLSGSLRKEENFWTEFFKNQKNNETELYGGLKPLYFSSEDKSKLLDLVPTISIYHKYKIKRKRNTKLSNAYFF